MEMEWLLNLPKTLQYYNYFFGFKAREGGGQLQQLSAQLRSQIILDFAAKIKDNLNDILEANATDIRTAKAKSN